MEQNFNQPQMTAAQVFSQSTQVNCSECNSMFFEQSVLFRKVSKIITGTPTDQLVPVMVYRCQDCLQPLTETMPPELISELIGEDEDSTDGNIITMDRK